MNTVTWRILPTTAPMVCAMLSSLKLPTSQGSSRIRADLARRMALIMVRTSLVSAINKAVPWLINEQSLMHCIKWINQRPGLEFGNYGDVSSYRAEDAHHWSGPAACAPMVNYVAWHDSITAEMILDAADRQAFDQG